MYVIRNNLSETDYLDNVYAICPRIIDLDGIDQNPSLDKKISRFKIFFYDMYFLNFYFGKFIYKIWQKIKKRRKPGEVDLNNRNIFLGYGAIYVLTTVFFQNNSSLDTPPFLMGEEAFLAYQIKETGGVQFFDSSLIVYHKDHSSCNNVPKQKMYFYTKDSYKFYRKKLLELPKIKD
jgi:GT2 family glycosyltransferase